MKILICFVVCVAAVSSESSEAAIRGEFPNLFQGNYAKSNEVIVAGSSGISASKIEVGREALESLVANNAGNSKILDEMFPLFSAIERNLAWHLTYQVVSYGSPPDQYVYYLFDRNNTELLVAGYKRCV